MIQWLPPLTNWVISNSKLNDLTSINPLKGATSSKLYLLSDSYGTCAVIRFYTNEEWLRKEPDLAEHEAFSLLQASKSKINSPKLYAYTYNKDISPYPAVLMSYMPGEVVLPKTNIKDWLRELASLLANFHSTPIPDTFRWRYKPYNTIHSVKIPSWSKYKTEFQDALSFAEHYSPSPNIGFIHRDFHPVNVLWNSSAAIGIVDWPNACLGPREVDVGHCRLNLALVYGVETADQFLLYYIEETNTNTSEQSYWDLITLFDLLPDPGVYKPWLEFGMTHLTEKLIKTRVDAYFSSIYHSIVKIS